MINEGYLEKCKKERDTYMDDAEESIDKGNSVAYEEMRIEIKKAHALEIIAETLISINEKLEEFSHTPTSNGIKVRVVK